jgi:hypothetical protein
VTHETPEQLRFSDLSEMVYIVYPNLFCLRTMESHSPAPKKIASGLTTRLELVTAAKSRSQLKANLSKNAVRYRIVLSGTRVHWVVLDITCLV